MIQKIKYSNELLKTKIRLEKELTMVRSEIVNEQNTCNHIPAMLYYGEIYCVLCGKELDDKNDYINAVSGDTVDFEESYGSYLDNRMKYLQDMVVDIVTNDEIITSNEVFKILKKKINNK